jgi:hypothetical protein
MSLKLLAYILDKRKKVQPRTGHENPSLTSALDGFGGQRHAPTALPL